MMLFTKSKIYMAPLVRPARGPRSRSRPSPTSREKRQRTWEKSRREEAAWQLKNTSWKLQPFLTLTFFCFCFCWLGICFQLWSVYAWWRPVLGWNCCNINTLRVTLSKADRGPQNLESIHWRRPPSIRSSELTSLPEGWTTRIKSKLVRRSSNISNW